MGETKNPRQTVMFVGHHDQRITDDLAKDLMRSFRHESVSNATGEPASEADDKEQFRAWKSYREPTTLRFHYPKPLRPGEKRRVGTAEVVIGVRMVPAFELDDETMATVPLFAREREKWFSVVAGGTRIDYDSAFDMAWFSEKVHRALSVFQPDFGFADTRSNVAMHIGDDPRRRVWPILLYGPSMIEKLGGRERVLEAPVWRAEELRDGAVWLQAAENPLTVEPRALIALAEYFGLETR